MTIPSSSGAATQLISEVLEQQTHEQEQLRDAAHACLALALEDLRLGAFESAGSAVRQALRTQPADPLIRAAFRRVEGDTRKRLYARQDWTNTYLVAQIAWRQGDLDGARQAVSTLSNFETNAAPSFNTWMEAQALIHEVQERAAVLDSFAQIARRRLQLGEIVAARAICWRNLHGALAHPGLVAVARDSGLQVEQQTPTSHFESLPSVDAEDLGLPEREPETAASQTSARRARAAVAGVGAAVRPTEDGDELERAFRTIVSVSALRTLVPILGESRRDRVFVRAARAAEKASGLLRNGELSAALSESQSCIVEFPKFAIFRFLLAATEAEIWCSAWEYRNQVWDELETAASDTERSVVLGRALATYPREPLFRREWEITERRANWTNSGNEQTVNQAHLVKAPERNEPKRGPRRSRWWPAAVFSLCGVAVFGFLVLKDHSGTAPHANVPRPQRAVDLTKGKLPVRIVSRVPVYISVDSNSHYAPDTNPEHVAVLPAGTHFVSVANEQGAVELLVKWSADKPTRPLMSAVGFIAALVSDGHLLLSGPPSSAIGVDGKQIAPADWNKSTAIGAGRHQLQLGHETFAFDLPSGNQRSILAFIAQPPAVPNTLAVVQQEQQPRRPGRGHEESGKVGNAKPARTLSISVPKAVQVAVISPVAVPPTVNALGSATGPSLPDPITKTQPSYAPAVRTSPDDEQVVAVLRRYADAWRSKDPNRITALRPTLSRRSVKEGLDGVQVMAMSIVPAGAPHIEGDRATIDCIHKVSEVYGDGIEKRSPDMHVTYVLARHGNSWIIEDTR